MSSEAFGETLQFVTKVKLQELEKHRQAFNAQASKILERARAAPDVIAKVDALAKGIEEWHGTWSADSSNLKNIQQWIEEAKRDPGFPQSVVKGWAEKLERQISNEGTQFDYARLFGDLLTEWLRSSPHSEGAPAEAAAPQEGFEKIDGKTAFSQTEELESIIYTDNNVDTAALQKYLEDLFAEKEAAQALKKLRERLGKFGKTIGADPISVDDMKLCIRSLLATDLLSDAKQRTLKEFAESPTVIKEIASVLDMQLATLDTWSWPEEGVVVEPRRALNGKVRFFLDPEILTALLLQWVGIRWCVEFKEALLELKASPAWKTPAPILNEVEKARKGVFDANYSSGGDSIDDTRRDWQDNYFMCQLPTTKEESAKDAYNEERDDDSMACPTCDDESLRFDTPIERKQSLLHLVSTDILLNRTLHGRCTVVCTDVQWFGPSLSHDAILTVLRFLGLTDADVRFMKAFLKCPLRFAPGSGASSAAARVRVRGTPISFALSALCGEAVLFMMDFAVNQRASALFLYRLHDDFWFLSPDRSKCVAAWKELERYAAVAGLTFNAEKTGCVQVGDGSKDAAGLPEGNIRWGMLRLDAAAGGKFILDQEEVDKHIAELRRQLAACTSLFGWVQAYNAYMAFVVRNCGRPAKVFGRGHVDDVIATLVRIQRALFPAHGGDVVGHLAGVLKQRFERGDIPVGWYLWPTAAGGLELKDFAVELLAVRKDLPADPAQAFEDAVAEDHRYYAAQAQKYEDNPRAFHREHGALDLVPWHAPFWGFDEYARGRVQYSRWWLRAYERLMHRPEPYRIESTTEMRASVKKMGLGIAAFGGNTRTEWMSLKPYWQWVVAMHHDDMLERYGGLEIVKPSSIPVGMVALFKGSKTRWEQ